MRMYTYDLFDTTNGNRQALSISVDDFLLDFFAWPMIGAFPRRFSGAAGLTKSIVIMVSARRSGGTNTNEASSNK